MATEFEAGTATAMAVAKGVLVLTPGGRRPELDIIYDCLGYDRNGNPNQGVGFAYASASGEIPFIDLDATAIAYASASGTLLLGGVYAGDVIAYASAHGDMVLGGGGGGRAGYWIRWSDIGHLDFTVGRDNVAGKCPPDWRGDVYEILKLDNKVIVYGANGVSILTPVGSNYGVKTIYRIGLKSKQAVTGDDNIHFFIDNKGQLYSLGEGLQKLDYSEYLSPMNSIVMSYDVENELVYICDGTSGYVYSPRDNSLGSGPVNVTGISSRDGILYAVAPAVISTPTFEICTDIYDFGTRRNKRVCSIEIGTDLTETLEAAIDYRSDKAASFVTTDWHVVDPRGMAFIPVLSQEVRARVRSTVYNWFAVDYITFNGETLSH